MKKTVKYMVLASLLSTTVLAPVALAANEDSVGSKAFATFIDESTVDPNGPLRFDRNNAPTDIQFGQILIAGDTTDYSAIYDPTVLFQADGEAEAQLAPLNVTTIDNRGTSAGWIMSVKLSKQFATDSGKTLPGAKLTLSTTEALSTKPVEARLAPTGVQKNVVLAENVDFQNMMVADNGEGVGTWTTLFGPRLANDGASHIEEILNEGKDNEYTVYTKNDNVKLTVPGSITKVEEAYKAELTWSLADTPEVTP